MGRAKMFLDLVPLETSDFLLIHRSFISKFVDLYLTLLPFGLPLLLKDLALKSHALIHSLGQR